MRLSRSPAGGFSIVEISIALLIAGVILFLTAQLARPLLGLSRLNATRANMKEVVQVLAAYAQHNNRIPCPADPDASDTAQPQGAEVGSGAGGIAVPDTIGNGGCKKSAALFNEGIVPYATLGMPVSDVKDGWGNYLTYHVDPVFALNPSPAAPTVAPAHARCRQLNTWVTGSPTSAAGTQNRNGPKARFCCPGASMPLSSQILVMDVASHALWNLPIDTSTSGPVDTPIIGSTFDVVAKNVTAIAFVLVSHGPDGVGSFLGDGTRRPATPGTGTSETDNMDGSNIFVTAPQNDVAGATHFDDVVIWQTQDTLYSSLGHMSCQIP